ncbi:hypothetical protein KVR01_007289 [Diaporthe batatas]|uniref:uncharacterized protein n=1 Tax=Diaporthe batatas TaxID=748121 RepID=UPI001D05B6CD|nr:uncharacterized protein KVR01_007289 [Diaporthe batatas]KAG8162811.1 hypothetical protein KVR01_007289 [Diaporthe batatas]
MDMSLSEKSIGNTTDNIWQRHESEIRSLYQTKHLEEVKDIMERKHGFPKLANKTWHEKLGNRRIRKTVKNQVWGKVYRHCAHYRLEDPSRKQGDKRLKRTKRPTEVIYGDRTYSWAQAWRNMKHSGAIVGPQLDPPSPLPPDITVRTPPSVPCSSSPRMSFDTLQPRDEINTAVHAQIQVLSFECALAREDHTYSNGGGLFIQQFHPLEPSPHHPLQANGSCLADCLRAQMLVFLPGLPIWNLSNRLAEMADLNAPSQGSFWPRGGPVTALTLTPNAMSSLQLCSCSEIPRSNESVFQLSDLFSSLTITRSSSALATFTAQHRPYITLSMAIYLLSNNISSPGRLKNSGHTGFFENLDSTLKEMPARHIRSLLQSRLPSVRAAFEALLSISGTLKQPFAFKSLVQIGIGNGWLATSTQGHELLCHAVCMDLDEVVQMLLEIGCRPDGLLRLKDFRTTAIIEALKRRKIHCTQLLLKHCDINTCSNFRLESHISTTSFTFFLSRMNDLDEMLFDQGIRLFLDAGADINSPYEVISLEFVQDVELELTWSALDCLFCFCPSAFHKFTPNWSPSEDSMPTRAGIRTSVDLGSDALNEYCHRLAQQVRWEYLYEFFERLIIEQIRGIGPWGKLPSTPVHLNTFYALVDLGVSMNKALSRIPNALTYYIHGREEIDIDIEVIRYLLDNSAVVDDKSLELAARLENTDILALLIQNVADIRQQGLGAVMAAATHNNFEAVKALVDAGVDLNTDFNPIREPACVAVDGYLQPSSLLCQIIERWEGSFEDLSNMISFLVERGAHLRLSAIKPGLPDLMESIIRRSRYKQEGVVKGVVGRIISLGCDLRDPDVPSARLWEACGFVWGESDKAHHERIEIFELLFRKGARLRPGAPLATWILMGGGTELVNEMLYRGVDIDAYYHKNGRHKVRNALQAAAERCSEELVVLLLQKGADVNALARGHYGRTALQAICDYGPRSPAQQVQQINIINLLLSHGADVNAHARGQCGRTALQAICDYDPRSPAEHGQQINIINHLLTHGANVNAAPARRGGRTAMQLAAERGRLEIVMLLLSSEPSADVNMPPCKSPGFLRPPYHIALDMAAEKGRLDTVKFLLDNNALSGRPGLNEWEGHLAVAELIREHAETASGSDPTRTDLSQPQRDWREYGYEEYSDGDYSEPEYSEYEEDNKDDEPPEPGDEQDPLVQLQVQHEAVEHPGFSNTAPEPGFVWDMGDDNSFDFNIGFRNLPEDMGGIYDPDNAISTSNIDTVAPHWGLC